MAEQPRFSQEARQAAIAEVVTARFNSAVKDAFLAKGMTVRGLRWALEQASKRRAGPAEPGLEALLPTRFDDHAGAAAKLELVKGKVVFTAVASAEDPAAAVLASEGEELRLGYLVAAEVSSEGDLGDLDIRRVDEARVTHEPHAER